MNFATRYRGSLQRRIDIRVYSALPPVQMYRVGDQGVVSFLPGEYNAARYQTNPRARLGTPAGTKFDVGGAQHADVGSVSDRS